MAAPSLTLMALDLMPRTRGLASSCQGFLQTSSNVLAAGLIAPFFWDSALRLSLGMAILFAGAAVACLLSARRSSP